MPCLYTTNTKLIANRLHFIGSVIDMYYSKYDNLIVPGDFNTGISYTFFAAVLGIMQFKKPN